MALASVPYSFAPLTDILSSEANANFAAVVNFLNNQTIHKDGTVAATGHLSGPATAPVSDTQYANKAYVDRAKTLDATVATSQTTTSTSFTNLATVGPAVTFVVPASGKVLVSVYCLLDGGASGTAAAMGFELSGANVLAAADSKAISNVGTEARRIGATFPLGGLTPGSTTFTAKYRRTPSGTATFADRILIVQGVIG